MTERYLPEPLDEQTRELLAIWTRLTPRKRSAVLRLIRAFV